ncbi:MAG: hypothetical protein P1U44_13065 [Vicingaceae bacterium]|nr:hypothetical protein [Vicingaceae bacterium]
MTKIEILSEIEHVKNESRKLQSKLVQELRELEQAGWSVENKTRMAELNVLHAKDLWNTFSKVYDLEEKLNLL